MNIALGAVLIFILLIPPIAFYFSYSFGRFAKAGPKFTLLDGILASAIFALFIHAIATLIIGVPVQLNILVKLVGGDLKDIGGSISNARLSSALRQFALYNGIIFVLAIITGRFARALVVKFDLGFRHELLRLNNRWWYLFNGYYLPEVTDANYDLLFVDAVVDTQEGTFIYSGYLVEFVCEGEELQRLYLNDTIRRTLNRKVRDGAGRDETWNEPGDPVDIPGQFFVIEYKQVKNMNLRFISLENTIEDIEQLEEE